MGICLIFSSAASWVNANEAIDNLSRDLIGDYDMCTNRKVVFFVGRNTRASVPRISLNTTCKLTLLIHASKVIPEFHSRTAGLQ